MINRRLLRAITEREISTSDFLEMSECLDHVSGEEKRELQDKIAAVIETIYPYREGKAPEEDAAYERG